MIEENAIPYDDESAEAIEKYSQNLIGKTFYDILNFYCEKKSIILDEKIEYYNNSKGKGSLGTLIEEYFFNYKPNNDSQPDFPKARVELKVTPYEITKKGNIRAGERLVIKKISYDKPIESDFDSSSLKSKIELILLILYLRKKNEERLYHKINYSKLFSIVGQMCEEDILIIKNDYKKITSKIQSGKAHELSESDTEYLGASTKGSTAEKSNVAQYYNPLIKAKTRAFCLKKSYMTYVINKYILGNVTTYESIIKDPNILRSNTFENYIINKMKKYVGLNEEDLLKQFDLNYNDNKKPKNFYSILAFRMLGIKSNQAEEFVKADISVKSIRVEKNRSILQHMSLPVFKSLEFVKEEFEDSKLYNYFSEKKFLFVVFENRDGTYFFKGAKLWNMPNEDLEGIGYSEWKNAQNVISKGIVFKIKGNRVQNNLPNASETKIFHVRPHNSKSVYNIKALNLKRGNFEKHSDLLPNGDKMTKQCFWLNRKYLMKQIDSLYN